jgi:lipid-A-disaccharide synthase
MRMEVLVVAGEASGDRIAGLTATALAAEGVRCWGIGGPACREAGVETVVDTAAVAAMGLADVVGRAAELGGALSRVLGRVRREAPRAALLVNFTEMSQRLGRWLRGRGTRVLWCVAPQVWAWRPRRIGALREAADRMAVILPFEEKLWRDAGYDAVYVGHPAMEAPSAGARPSSTPGTRPALAVLPGSREGEVARLLDPFLRAAVRLLDGGVVRSGCLVRAPGLAPRVAERMERRAREVSLPMVEADPVEGAGVVLGGWGAPVGDGGFDVSICASGTATLEAALRGAAPVVAYRLDPLAFAVARRLVGTPHIALPNVLLGRRAFPELVQGEVTPARLAEAARRLVERREETAEAAAALRAVLAPPSPAPFGRRVADRMLPWLC